MCPNRYSEEVGPRWGVLTVLLTSLFVLVLHGAGLAQTSPSATEWLPAEALIAVEVHRPRALLERLAGEEMSGMITSLPLYQEQASKPKFQEFLNVIRFLEASLETDWRTALAKLTGGGITIAVCPQDTVVAIVDAEDEHMLVRLHEILLTIARSEAEKQGHPQRVASKAYRGVTAWTFGGQETHAIVGKRLIFSNHSEAVREVLDRRAGDGGASLANQAAFKASKRVVPSDAVATGFVNLEPLLVLPPVNQVLEQQRANPLAALIFAGIGESLRRSTWLGLGLDVDGQMLRLHAVTDGAPPGPSSSASFAIPQKAGDGARSSISVPRRIAAMSLYRDLHAFYAAKDTLFPERTSGLIFFENMMGIFFTGRDLTSEVLAETEPEVRVVVAAQPFDPAIGTPEVKLPAFAFILRLRRPEQFGSVVEEAWQKAIGLINFTRGQQALPGLIIDRPSHGQTKYTVAYFSTADVQDKTRLDTRFNVRPTLAMPGDYLILSSTDSLARDLIDALESSPKSVPIEGMHSLLEFEGSSAASVLLANREALVRQDMVKKGRTYEEAKAGIDLLLTMVRCIDRASLRIGTREDLTQFELQVGLAVPVRGD